jgi:hypothetical protein
MEVEASLKGGDTIQMSEPQPSWHCSRDSASSAEPPDGCGSARLRRGMIASRPSAS